LADAAHGVVFHLDLDRPQHRAILERYKAVLREDVPIRVATTFEQARRYASLLAGVQVWTHEPGTGDLDGFAAEVEAAERFQVQQ
jgi:pentose-5-phosphate-3-epimerase